MSDVEEFLAEAANKPKQDPNKTTQSKRLESPPPDAVEGSIEGGNSAIGQLVQWSFNGPGFSPTTKTTGTIPPGIYDVDQVNRLLTFIPRKVSTDSLIRLPDSKSDMVIDRVKKFWDLKDQFKNGNERAKGGFLHKMGMMLFGPPGSGKTSTVKFIMQDIIQRGGIVVLGSSHPSFLGDGLLALREIEPNKPVVVVFEDFDELIVKYTEAPYLAILDGEYSIDNALFIATTNYPSRFDPRMYNRPGRFADVVKIGMPTPEARRMYLEHQLKNPADIEEIVEKTEGFSLDHLRAVILGTFFEGRPLDEEIKRLKTLFKPPKDEQGNERKMGFSED